jgi:hypothetical protein
LDLLEELLLLEGEVLELLAGLELPLFFDLAADPPFAG